MSLALSFAAIVALASGGPAAAPDMHKDHPGGKPADHKNHDAHCGLPGGKGAVVAIDVKNSKLTLAHEPIAELDWPEMTMNFAVAKSVDLAAFATGEKVHFLLAPLKGKTYRIASLCSLDVADGAHEACMKSMHETAMKVAAENGKSCAMKPGAPGSNGHEGHH